VIRLQTWRNSVFLLRIFDRFCVNARSFAGISGPYSRYWWLLFLVLIGPVARAKVISAIPGMQTFAYGVWFFDNCTTSAGLGTLVVNIQPKYGVATVGTGSGPIPGCPAGSPSLPLAESFYTMNNATPPPTYDYFQLEFFLNGKDYGPVDIYVLNGNIVGKELGGINTPNKHMPGEPIDIASGNVYYSVTDYTTSGQNPLAYTRYYNSLGNLPTQLPILVASDLSSTRAIEAGGNWRSNYDRYLKTPSPTTVIAERPDGQQLTFTLNGSTWTPDTDIDMTLTESGNQWTLTDSSDTVESYSTVPVMAGYSPLSAYARLDSITSRNGYTQNLTYSGGVLSKVTDSYGRSLDFAYSNGQLETVTTPDGLVISFAYTTLPSAEGIQLTSVTYSTTPQTSQTYQYGASGVPFALTGIIDEDGNNYASWTYDGYGRGLTSHLGAGANATTFVYTSDTSHAVTNALGVTDTYTFTTLQTIPKVVQIDRAATSNTAAATEKFTYDSNGYVASETDWNGNLINFTNNAHGLPTTIDEAAGSNVARTTTVAYDSIWAHLPASIVTPGVTASFTYDSHGELLTRVLTDTTSTTTPYSTSGQTRTWTNTWSNYLLASAQTPNGNKTQFGYDGSGALTSVTDALNHVTQIITHTAGGLPETIIDPNGVTTTRTYDARQRVISSTVTGSTGTYKTNWSYDDAGNLIQTILPDTSFLANNFDAAHRLTAITDADGNYIKYTLDALGDRTQSGIFNRFGTETWQRSGTFDSLGRELVETAGAGQTSTRTYDANSNVLTLTDGQSHSTTNAYDSLNRLTSSADANGGVTTPAYDSHDRVVSVTDANGNTTSYVRDGFGDVLQQTSLDSGTAVFHYDGDTNLISKTDALGITTNQTFDALDRPLTTTYSSDATENVAYTYDQTASGFSFGIGRLTSVKDAAGSLTRAYDELGNLVTEQRVNGKNTLTTGYTYDPASRIASMTYPDSALVKYQRDAAGYLINVSATIPGASVGMTAAITHQPFGPINSVKFGNGISESWSFDQSYLPTNIADALSGTNLQNLTYAYDKANNVTSITDAVNAANTQTLGYDVINRLINAASGPGGYGSFAWTYDKVGNRLTQTSGTTSTTYGYTTGTNRLATITTATGMALVRHPVHGQPPRSLAFVRPPLRPIQRRPPPTEPDRPQKAEHRAINLATIIGWPLLLLGFGGIIAFRKRLLSSPPLSLLIAALLIGGATVIIGCGGGGGGSGSNPSPTPTAATPTFSPGAGTYTSIQTVSISDATSGAALYYTTDGTAPTTSSTPYKSAIAVSATETISAIAAESGYKNSAVATAAYTINLPAAATPTFSPAAGNYSSSQSVTISDSTAGAAIVYTTDGSTPTASSTAYTGAITVSSSETIKAIATATGYTTSAVASAAYTITPSNTISVVTNANGNITSIPPENGTASATFSYNAANRLSSVTGTPSLAASYVYDYAGKRFSKTNPSSTPILYSYAQDGTLISENNSGVITDYIYADSRPIAVLQPDATPAASQINYLLADRQGTPQKAVNSAGTVVWSASYAPFGGTNAAAGPVVQNLRMPGQTADAETGFYHNGFRDYIPGLGRYLETDPIGISGGLNTYLYAYAAPMNGIDTFGLCDQTQSQPAQNPAATAHIQLAQVPPIEIFKNIEEEDVPVFPEEEVAPPVSPPFEFPQDLTKPPGPGWEWRGAPDSEPGDSNGNWYNPDTGEWIHNDMGHEEPIGPHLDYQPPNGAPVQRWFPNGTMTPKTIVIRATA